MSLNVSPSVSLTPVLWERKVHEEPAWGTVITIDVRGDVIDTSEWGKAVAETSKFFDDVNRWFSPYLAYSTVSLWQKGVISASVLPSEFREVSDRCKEIKKFTGGAFDPWAVPGGANFTGYVKGWAAQKAAYIFLSHGFSNVCVNAAGDLWCEGFENPGDPWSIGIQHPRDPSSVMATVKASGKAVCTSGTYIKGDHIVNPATSKPVSDVISCTVVGAEGGLADALASAGSVLGLRSAEVFASLEGWEFIVVTARDEVFRWVNEGGSSSQ